MPGDRQIKPPSIPKTPSRAINDMLKKNCNKTFDNVFQAGLAYYICAVFQGITVLYNTIYQDKSKPSHRMWMISCAAVSALIILKSFLIFKVVMSCTSLLYGLLYYSAWLLALFGVGLGVSGMVFFDKEGAQSPVESFRSDASRVLYEAREAGTNRVADPRDQFNKDD